MNINPRILEQELKKTRQLMEDIAIVNSGDLYNNNWSANYHTNKKQGLEPFQKNKYVLTPLNKPIEHKLDTVVGPGDLRHSNISYKLKDTVYTRPEFAKELNEIGKQIEYLINQYNEKYQQYVKD